MEVGGIQRLRAGTHNEVCKRFKLLYGRSPLQTRKAIDETTSMRNAEISEYFENFTENQVSSVTINECADESSVIYFSFPVYNDDKSFLFDLDALTFEI